MGRLCVIVTLVLILCLMIGCQNKDAMAELEAMEAQAEVEKQNEALMRRSFEEWNKGSSDFFMEATTPDYTFCSPSGNRNPMPREKAVENVEMFWKGFPDISFSIEDIIAEGDMIITKMVVKGTHEGEFMGIPATGRKIEVSGIIISRIENGKFVKEWEEMDNLGLMTQLGMELKQKDTGE